MNATTTQLTNLHPRKRLQELNLFCLLLLAAGLKPGPSDVRIYGKSFQGCTAGARTFVVRALLALQIGAAASAGVSGGLPRRLGLWCGLCRRRYL
jgi:hypothetical protein